MLERADLLTSILVASGRGNALPIVNGNQDRLAGRNALKVVSRAADRLPSGTVVLTEEAFMNRPPRSFASDGNPSGDKMYGDYFVARASGEIRRRFDLRVVARGKFGLVVVELRRNA